jgi:hypothetical protein
LQIGSTSSEEQVQVMCQLGILLRPAIILAAINRVALALSQFVDSLDTLTRGRIRMDPAVLDSSNQAEFASR